MNATLWNSIGQIDDGLILDANEGTVKALFRRKKQTAWFKAAALAATVVLAVGISLPLIRFMSGANGKQSEIAAAAGEPLTAECPSSSVSSSDGTVTYVSNEGNQVVFVLEKSNDYPVQLLFFAQKRVSPESAGETDESHPDEAYIEPMYAIVCQAGAENDYESVGERLENVLQIKVNGEKTNCLPTAKGTYVVEVDYSQMFGEGITVNDWFYVTGYGPFRLTALERKGETK